ncbi:GntR family transcriptional regulator [Kineosporia succinea]|uniref:DNA-binding GntR family transcriptional regulator n=1 Tax=Kineosporia succinea TaxID=84632 RepID=A0ABT9PCZ7_9ACTN|nr:GntR family transcriptional regulator [Kineosporia succinea]MDP9830584.1 DNA-binding GntR family transcriptional regulator [Kineosporia succinea]
MTDASQNRLTRDSTFSRRTEAVLRDMILDGQMAPGERINEVSLAQALGISRGPLREAIQRLAAEGLLTVISHRGAFVRTFERYQVDELYDLRTALESHVVRLVCQRATDEEVAALGELVRETGAIISASPDAAYPADHDLHTRLIELARNETMGRATLEAQRQIQLARRMSAKAPARARDALGEHQDLIAAIQRRDADRAAALMTEHLDAARRGALDALGFAGS